MVNNNNARFQIKIKKIHLKYNIIHYSTERNRGWLESMTRYITAAAVASGGQLTMSIYDKIK